MDDFLLLTPGPTKIPERLREVLGRPIIHHRTNEFQAYLKECVEGLKHVYQTQNDVFLFGSSGTGAMEAAVCNLLSAGDTAITVEGGKFGERWTEICQAYGINAVPLAVEWGKAVTPRQIEDALAKNKNVKAVFITLCETSTGVDTDVKAIGDVVKKTDAVLVVDAVSSLAVVDLQTDNWGVDVVVSGSHKGFMLPPGLAFASVSPKAMKLAEASTTPRYYWDFRKCKQAMADVDTPFTPPIGIVIALVESIRMIKEEGLKNVFARISGLAQKTREAAKAMGLTLLPDESCISDVLTAINLPENINGKKLVKIIRDEDKISMAGGQGHLTGKIVRISHLGCVDEADLIRGLNCLRKRLEEMGYQPANKDSVEKVFAQTA